MIKIEVDSREIDAALKRLEASTDNLRPALDDVGAGLVANIQDQLGQGQTPWGDAFAPLAKPRKRQGKRRAGDVPLNDTHQHIYNRIEHVASHNDVEVAWYGDSLLGFAHQFGSEKNHITARPFMPIKDDAVDLPADWEAEILDTLISHIEKAQ